jgi:hypothetical protein
MVTANPCVTVDHEFDERNGTYVLDVITQPGEGACTQCVGMVTYNATVDATTSYFQLEVKHNGETVKTFAPPQEENTSGLNPGADNESESGEVEQPKKGIFSGIFNWFRSFF